jgi:uncharacterized protein (TIGR02145 family)
MKTFTPVMLSSLIITLVSTNYAQVSASSDKLIDVSCLDGIKLSKRHTALVEKAKSGGMLDIKQERSLSSLVDKYCGKETKSVKKSERSSKKFNSSKEKDRQRGKNKITTKTSMSKDVKSIKDRKRAQSQEKNTLSSARIENKTGEKPWAYNQVFSVSVGDTLIDWAINHDGIICDGNTCGGKPCLGQNKIKKIGVFCKNVTDCLENGTCEFNWIDAGGNVLKKFKSNGMFRFIPTETGTFKFKYKVTNKKGFFHAGWLTINVESSDKIIDNDDNCLSNVYDCLGICDGDAVNDNCGTCDSDPANDCERDCNLVWGGTATIDNCWYCTGGSTGIDPCVQDCLTGEWCYGNQNTNQEIPEDRYCDNPDTDNDGICDWNDGDAYETVIIGEQEWMAENLKVTHYSNGDEIPTGYSNSDWTSLSTGIYAVYNNNEGHQDTYGYLYNWYAVDDDRGVCPEGWHVPTNNEWNILSNYLGGSSIAGGKMKTFGPGATNETGFTGLRGGYRNGSSGTYGSMGSYGYFWSSTEYGNGYAWLRRLGYNNSEIYLGSYYKRYGFSVRCVRD